MIFRSPEWLALLPVALLAGWFFPRLGLLWRPLRLACVALVTFALMHPQVPRYADGLDLYVLLDRSESTEDLVDRGLPEWRSLLEKGRRSADDQIIWLDYASEVVRRGETGAELYDRNRKLTRTKLAVEHVLAVAKKDKLSRVVVFTDGFATEPLDDLKEKLAAQGIALDYRIIAPAQVADARVSRLTLPEKVQVAEPFLIEVEVRGAGDVKLPLVLRRDDREITRTEIELKRGTGTLRFTDRVPLAGAHRYEAVIEVPQPDRLGNNRHEAWVEVSGGPVVLLVTKYTADPVAQALEKQGFTVQTVLLPAQPQLGQLAGAKAVILNNVPAFELPNDFLRSLDFYVREQGGSLLMAGGKQSFGAGGYFESPVDPLLPVSMELKTEHRKLSVAMAIILDRSGSMSMTVSGGKQKMDLANEGAANAIQFLGGQDYITVYAVDSTAHEMVPLQQIGSNRDKMSRAVRRIQSMGGGIFVYEGLQAGWDAIRKTEMGQRHIILFSDAADSEEPGAYKKLLAEVTKEGGTVSVIALGTRSDSDAKLLEDIATLGNGRIFFTDKAEDVPTIFSQETIAVARSAFIREATPTQGGPGWLEISGQALEWLPQVDGYNLSYLREWASQGLVTTDEYAAPLVAFGQRGLGRTAAVSFPLGGEFSDRIRAWPKYGDFVQTLARWMLGEQMPAGIGLRHKLEGMQLSLELLSDETWETKLAERAPRILLASGPRAENRREITWRRLAPGHYQATTELQTGELVRGVVQVGGSALTFGPLTSGASVEWAFDGARLDELRTTSSATGGLELLELEQAWRNPPVKQFSDIRLPLVILALLGMLAEALVTRTGWRLPVMALVKPQPKAAAATDAAAKKHRQALQPTPLPPPPAPAARPAPPKPAAPVDDEAQRQSRFARAKKK